MNPEEKNSILRLRSAGAGYKRIASELHLSVNSVKSFCQRQGLERIDIPTADASHSGVLPHGLQSKADASACKQCGRPIAQIAGRKEKRFCCDSCRMKWWHAHKDKLNHKTAETRICAGCGADMTPPKGDARKYCSRSCYLSHRFQAARWG